jgi:predicted RNase H-like HicB family nuclease
MACMSDALHLTIVYEQDPDSDWIVVSIPEVPGVLSQGRTREEAREMVLDALGGMLELRAAEHEPIGKTVDSESLEIVAA